ncbi:14903_t:CDS:2, partial [Gigaspora rosea]
SDMNLESIPNGLKQMNDQINKENRDQQSQLNKKALEKFLPKMFFIVALLISGLLCHF